MANFKSKMDLSMFRGEFYENLVYNICI